jgi:hypothetical protein
MTALVAIIFILCVSHMAKAGTSLEDMWQEIEAEIFEISGSTTSTSFAIVAEKKCAKGKKGAKCRKKAKQNTSTKKKAKKTKQKFVHPGVLNTRQSISYVKARLGQEPWKLAFDRMRESEFANLAYVSQPVPSVDCGPYNQPDTGCTNQRRDGIAAYTHALIWSFTGDSTYAKKAQEILDSWASIHTQFTLENAGLMAAWSSEMYPRVGELLINTDWPGRGRFKQWLANVIYPMIKNGRPTTAGGNWDMSMADGLIQIGVFLDSPTMFNKGISLWKDRVRAYFYLKSDGSLPVSPRKPVIKENTRILSFWNSPIRVGTASV